MKTSDSHSWVIHSLPNRKLEKMSVCGILLVSKMYWPVLRCHQKSGSVIGWAARIKINAMKSKTSSRRVDNSSTGFRLESAEILTIGSSVLIRLDLEYLPLPLGEGRGRGPGRTLTKPFPSLRGVLFNRADILKSLVGGSQGYQESVRS